MRKALDDEYFGVFRGAMGMNNLWTSFNENNEKQKASLEANKNKAWIPFRTLKLYVSSQETKGTRDEGDLSTHREIM